MGLLVYVYKSSLGDCTNGGITSKANEICITNIDGPFEPSKDCPAALLVEGNVPNSAKIIPADKKYKNKWLMDGGNIADCSDSRFCSAVAKLQNGISSPVAIHDRTE